MRRIYLDYAAATPLDPKVKAAMDAAPMGNPSSLHVVGQEASAALFRARRVIAKSLGIADPAGHERIIFTGSATEANNLALRGTLAAFHCRRIMNRLRMSEFGNSKRIRYAKMKPRIVVSAIEHESVLETARDLARENAELVILPVDRTGLINLSALRNALTPRTVLVSVMHANNEVGAIQPIAKISKIIAGVRAQRRFSSPVSPLSYPLFHTDAVQAFRALDCNPDRLGADLVTLSAHKIYGPKGIGCLYARDRSLLSPLITGGGQENGLRAGTENVAAAVGFAEAARCATALRDKEAKRAAQLQNYFWKKLRAAFPRIALNGPALARGLRLPHNLNIWFPGAPAQEFLAALDLAGVSASSGSACASRASKPSYVLRALGYKEKRAGESIRFTLGAMTSAQDIDAATRVIKNIYRRLLEERSE